MQLCAYILIILSDKNVAVSILHLLRQILFQNGNWMIWVIRLAVFKFIVSDL